MPNLECKQTVINTINILKEMNEKQAKIKKKLKNPVEHIAFVFFQESYVDWIGAGTRNIGVPYKAYYENKDIFGLGEAYVDGEYEHYVEQGLEKEFFVIHGIEEIYYQKTYGMSKEEYERDQILKYGAFEETMYERMIRDGLNEGLDRASATLKAIELMEEYIKSPYTNEICDRLKETLKIDKLRYGYREKNKSS